MKTYPTFIWCLAAFLLTMMSKAYGQSEKSWYSVMTKPKAEYQVAKLISSLNLPAYVPLTLQKGRAVPLLNSYVFVKAQEVDLHRIKYKPGVKDFVRFGQNPVVFKGDVIATINILENHLPNLKSMASFLVKGEEYCVFKGPMTGKKVKVTYNQRGMNLAYMIEGLGQSVLFQQPHEVLTSLDSEEGQICREFSA